MYQYMYMYIYTSFMHVYLFGSRCQPSSNCETPSNYYANYEL